MVFDHGCTFSLQSKIFLFISSSFLVLLSLKSLRDINRFYSIFFILLYNFYCYWVRSCIVFAPSACFCRISSWIQLYWDFTFLYFSISEVRFFIYSSTRSIILSKLEFSGVFDFIFKSYMISRLLSKFEFIIFLY